MARLKSNRISSVEGSVLNTTHVDGMSINSISNDNPTSRYNTDSGSVGHSSFNRNGETGVSITLAQRVISSIPYQQAFALFSSLTDKSWLQRLQAIPYSVDDANSTFLDDLGAVSNYEDKQDANYQYCMEQISALLAEYQSWNNSLPSTQANQLSQIGLNSAITGSNIQGSQIPNVGVASDPSALPSANVADFLLNTADFITSAVNGFADLKLKFKDFDLNKKVSDFNIDLAKSQFIKDVKIYSRENGIDIIGLNDWDSLKDWIVNDPSKISGFIKSQYELGRTHSYYAPLFNELFKQYPYLKDFPLLGYGDGSTYVDSISSYADTYDGMSDVASSLFELHQNQESFKLYLDKYNSEIAMYDVRTAEYASKSAEHQSKIHEYEAINKQLYTDLVKRLINSPNSSDQALGMKILTGWMRKDVELINAQIGNINANTSNTIANTTRTEVGTTLDAINTGANVAGQIIPF